MYGRTLRHNQIFSDGWFTKFYYPWCSAGALRAPELRYDVLAKSYCKERNDQESRKYAKELLLISKELGNKEQEAEAYDLLAMSYCKEENDQERRKYAKELLRISKELGNKEQEAQALEFLGKSNVEVNESEESKGSSKASPRISKDNWDKTELEAEACGCSVEPS